MTLQLSSPLDLVQKLIGYSTCQNIIKGTNWTFSWPRWTLSSALALRLCESILGSKWGNPRRYGEKLYEESIRCQGKQGIP